MGHYLVNFTVYTMAMLGLIFFAVFVYKKFFQGAFSESSTNVLKIEETLVINPRKSLMVVSAGNEKFLIASDVDKTSLISRLGQGNECISPEQYFRAPAMNDVSPINEKVTQNMSSDMPLTERYYQIRENSRRLKLEAMDDPTQKVKRTKRQNTVVLDFNQPEEHGFSSMKEMAKKINEL